MERKLSRRNLLKAGAASAAAVAVPAAAVAARVSGGSDAPLLAMIAKAEALWARAEDVNHRHLQLIMSLLPSERASHPDNDWIEAARDPRAAQLGREVKALYKAAEALDEPIRNYKPQTLEGAVAHADFISGDDDFREIVLANLRRIMGARS